MQGSFLQLTHYQRSSFPIAETVHGQGIHPFHLVVLRLPVFHGLSLVILQQFIVFLTDREISQEISSGIQVLNVIVANVGFFPMVITVVFNLSKHYINLFIMLCYYCS